MKKLLITGVSGLLGNNLAYYFKDRYEILGLYNSHPVTVGGIYTEKCDISDESSIKKIISEFDPSIIIHCASLTDIDRCEMNKELTREINVLSTKVIVDSIFEKDIKLVYISTDAVYDGVKGNFSEEDKIYPLNYYGRTKYEGELEIAKKTSSLIFRTNIFGWNIQDKKSLGEWILDELQANRNINGFKDAYFSSVYTLEFARIIDMAIQKKLTGVYNCGSPDPCSKYEFALKIADCFGLDKTLIKPILIERFDFKAKRGKDLSMNVMKLQKALDYRLPAIEQSIDMFYRDYKSGMPVELKKTDAGLPEAKFIPYARQNISESDIRYVVNVLRSDWLTQGPLVEDFEKELSEYCGTRHAVAMNSGTSALHAACLAAGIGKGDEVITSPITFVASANCAVYCNAKPVFADIDSKTYNIYPVEIERKITSRTKAVIPVHFAGQSCDMESIDEIVRSAERKFGHKIHIIEDACHSLGSLYKGNKVGAGVYSDMAVMSFHPVKHITTGEGGMVLTNDEILYKKLKTLRSHGITIAPDEFVNTDLAFTTGNQPSVNPWYYEQIELGYNYRLTDIQSALGLSQLKKLDTFRRRRREIVNRYNDAFRDVENITTPFENADCNSNFHLYVLLFDFERIGINRAGFMLKLRERGIQTQVHYIPVYLQPFYRKTFGTKWGDCPNAEEYYKKCLSIPLYASMADNDVEKVITEITEVISSSSRSESKC